MPSLLIVIEERDLMSRKKRKKVNKFKIICGNGGKFLKSFRDEILEMFKSEVKK